MKSGYAETYRRSLEQPEEFWAEAAEAIEWERRWDRVFDDSRPAPTLPYPPPQPPGRARRGEGQGGGAGSPAPGSTPAGMPSTAMSQPATASASR